MINGIPLSRSKVLQIGSNWLDKFDYIVEVVVVEKKGSSFCNLGDSMWLNPSGDILGGWIGEGCLLGAVRQVAERFQNDRAAIVETFELEDELSGVGTPCGGVLKCLFRKVEKTHDSLGISRTNASFLSSLFELDSCNKIVSETKIKVNGCVVDYTQMSQKELAFVKLFSQIHNLYDYKISPLKLKEGVEDCFLLYGENRTLLYLEAFLKELEISSKRIVQVDQLNELVDEFSCIIISSIHRDDVMATQWAASTDTPYCVIASKYRKNEIKKELGLETEFLNIGVSISTRSPRDVAHSIVVHYLLSRGCGFSLS